MLTVTLCWLLLFFLHIRAQQIQQQTQQKRIDPATIARMVTKLSRIVLRTLIKSKPGHSKLVPSSSHMPKVSGLSVQQRFPLVSSKHWLNSLDSEGKIRFIETTQKRTVV